MMGTRFWGAIALLLVAGPVGASTIRVQFDDAGARAALRVLADRNPSARELRAVTESRGYELMALQIEMADSLAPGDGAIRIVEALASTAKERSAAGQRAEYETALSDLRRDAGRLEFEIARRLGNLLPPGSDYAATVRIVVGGTNTAFAFSFGTDVVLRIDDFVTRAPSSSVGTLTTALDVDALMSTAIHELYHVGFRVAGGATPRLTHPDPEWITLASVFGPEIVGEIWRRAREKRWNGELMSLRLDAWVPPATWSFSGVDRFLSHLSRLQNEGSAVYAEAPAADASTSARRRAELDQWAASAGADFRILAIMADALQRGANGPQLDEIAVGAFRENGPFYRIGFHMARRIDQRTGRRALHAATSGGPLEFVERYLATHPDGPGEMDDVTERTLRQLIREIRGVGEFDPLD